MPKIVSSDQGEMVEDINGKAIPLYKVMPEAKSQIEIVHRFNPRTQQYEPNDPQEMAKAHGAAAAKGLFKSLFQGSEGGQLDAVDRDMDEMAAPAAPSPGPAQKAGMESIRKAFGGK